MKTESHLFLFSVQGFLPGHIICHNGNVSLWLWEQAGTQPKQGMKRGCTRWKWSGTKGWNEWKDREEERRRRERGEKDWSRLDSRLGHCRAVLSWSTLGEIKLEWNSRFTWKTWIGTDHINEFTLKHFITCHFQMLLDALRPFFGQLGLEPWAQILCGFSWPFNIRSSSRDNGCFWFAAVACSYLPQMKLESLQWMLLRGSLHHCIFIITQTA